MKRSWPTSSVALLMCRCVPWRVPVRDITSSSPRRPGGWDRNRAIRLAIDMRQNYAASITRAARTSVFALADEVRPSAHSADLR
jgi:hypothetical protein